MSATELPPRIVAQAIAELGADRVEQAWRYLEAWRVLGGGDLDPDERRSRLGLVPLTVLRHALEQPPLETHAMRRVKSWNNRGIAVLRSARCGNGKTHAAARWIVDGHAHGVRRCSWLAASSWPHDYQKKSRTRQQEWLDVGAKADRLVLDDIGSGSTGAASPDRDGNKARPWSAEPMEGMLMGRVDAGRPTIILTNSNEANLQLWLGARLGSRIQMGGNTWEVKGDDLRKPDTTEIDEQGRSPLWHAHAEILSVVGCVRGDDGQLVVGGNLERACEGAERDADFAVESKRDTARWAPVRNAIRLLGLDRRVVFERAAAMQAEESKRAAKFRADMKREHGLDVAGCSFGDISAALMNKLRNGQHLERERREQDLRARLAAGIPKDPHPTDVQTARTIAERRGLFVRGNDDDGFEVRCAEGLVAGGFKSYERAWMEAAMHESKIGAVA